MSVDENWNFHKRDDVIERTPEQGREVGSALLKTITDVAPVSQAYGGEAKGALKSIPVK
ncbi:MAG: hypothetical protein U0W24_03020 [Bacteroidales bacterium]